MIRKPKLAIFDIDGTIFRSSLLIEATEALIHSGIFPQSASRVYTEEHKKWSDRLGSYDEYIYGVIKAFEKNIKGVSKVDFEKIAKQTIKARQNQVYRYTRELVKDLKNKKYFLLAISHSPKELVDNFCAHLGFDKVYGRIYEVNRQGKFTGKTLYADQINDKSKILDRAIKTENLTLNGSIGVGDSESDIKFLRLVDRPICFNPNSILYRYAHRAGWEIVVERKDVIYKLK